MENLAEIRDLIWNCLEAPSKYRWEDLVRLADGLPVTYLNYLKECVENYFPDYHPGKFHILYFTQNPTRLMGLNQICRITDPIYIQDIYDHYEIPPEEIMACSLSEEQYLKYLIPYFEDKNLRDYVDAIYGDWRPLEVSRYVPTIIDHFSLIQSLDCKILFHISNYIISNPEEVFIIEKDSQVAFVLLKEDFFDNPDISPGELLVYRMNFYKQLEWTSSVHLLKRLQTESFFGDWNWDRLSYYVDHSFEDFFIDKPLES